MHLLAMMGKKSRITGLNEFIYSERHDVETQANVADDWIANIYGLPPIPPGSSNSGSLDSTNIVQPEGTCQNPDVHPAAQK
jgi:hypothetical protein